MTGRRSSSGRLRGTGRRITASSGYRGALGSARHVWHAPLPLVVVPMALVLLAVIVFGASRSANGRPAPVEVTTSGTPTPSPSRTPPPPPGPVEPVADVNLAVLRSQVEGIESRYGVRVGLAVAGVAPVGQRLTATWTAGSLTSGPTWGTLDVPIALAVLDLDRMPSNLTYLLTKSISESSLSSDEALYTFLGGADDAAQAVDKVFQEFGDPVTTVATSTDRQGVPPFTQTDWTVASQSEFAGQLWCSSGDWYVTSRMRHVDDEHSYGFGSVVGSYIKTSEGTTADDSVVARQMAIIPTSTGERVGVSLVVTAPPDRTGAAREAADAVAGQVYFTARGFEAGHC
ncbi:hypothetical protein [Propionibacterium acidifaciens]|uniref:hypothetical protein n=1 Tax=Propionibacterium acidifaciens TaxID=556499 RepID=UPI0023F19DAF|nr:hypothetical protein [Propionibacterium acidifaciens]